MGVHTAKGVPIDMSGATMTVTGANSFQVEYVMAGGSPYIANFAWDPGKNIFYMVDYSVMPDNYYVVGSWNLSSYAACSVYEGSWVIHFWPDYSFTDSRQYSGIYIIAGNNIEIYYPYATYSGTFDHQGLMNGSAGDTCWSATQIDHTPG